MTIVLVMIKVGHFTQYLLKRSATQNEVVKLSLINFLKNFESPNAPLTHQVLNHYIDWTMQFEYWRQNKKHIETFLLTHLTHFLSDFSHNISLDKVTQHLQRQIVVLEKLEDIQYIVQQRFKKDFQQKVQHKIILLDSQRILSVLLVPNQGLWVEIHRPIAALRQGQLELLQPMTQLKYDQHFDLSANSSQYFEFETHSVCKFVHQAEGQTNGIVLSGHHFKKTDVLSGPMSKNSHLFFALKNIEKHYIDSSSDPFYFEISSEVEKSMQLLSAGHAESLVHAKQVLKKAKLAVKHVFSHDDLLKLNVANLEYQMNRLAEHFNPRQELWPNQNPNP